MRWEARLARLAVLVPLLYFGTLFAAAASWPAYSHVTRYASELGGPEAPHPAIFNVGIMVMGVVCVLCAFGLHAAARRAGGRAIFSTLGAVCVGLFGVAMVMGGAFPMPNELHGAFGLGFAQVFAPLFFALALRGRAGLGPLAAVLLASFVLMVATMLVMMGVGHLVTRANVGLWQRANALAMFPWLGVAGAVLASRGDAGAGAA
jgi:hypothetical membrane protein